MADIYMPGIKSRFNTEQIIEDLMNLERIPRDRVEKNIESLQSQRGYWQEVGKHISSLSKSAVSLYNHQNPFSDRIVRSSNDSAITATSTREAGEQSYSFTVKQTAQADRFLSQPLDEKMRVDAGNYQFSIGSDEISINYRGGTLKDFVDTINRLGRDKISASLFAVQSGTKSLLIESKVTGKENRLGFSGDTVDLVTRIGMMEQGNDSRSVISINESTVRKGNQNISINDGVVQLPPRSSATLPLNLSISANSPLMLKLETLTKVGTGDSLNVVQPPQGPSVQSGSVTYGGITVQNTPSMAPLPDFKVPQAPVRNDSMDVLTLTFSDGTSAKLAPITDSNGFTTRQYLLSDVAQGRTIVSLNLNNENTHREVSIGKIEIFDPTSAGGLRPLNAVSSARDSVITMEGIEISRPTNIIDDLVPGLTLNVRGVSEKPVDLSVKADVEGIKDALISFVYNYNRLMLEINVLTRKDDRIVDEVTYLTPDESSAMRGKLGVFSSDSTLLNLKNNLMRIVTAPYPTSLERDLSLLAQIGISSNASRSGSGYDPSALRGYLQIDEAILDAALETKVPQIKQLFANNTIGGLSADTGVAYNLEAHVKTFVGLGGIITLKTNTIDSKITQDERRVTSLDRQLEAKEQELRIQYARMESAYARMEQMTSSLDNFNQQNRPNNR